MTTIDIALPYWGDPALAIAAVTSVRAQTDPNWRLTVIDDCYPDPTVREHVSAIEDSRVVYVRNDVNVGISANFRRSVELATSPYVTIMGSDDLLLPDYVGVIRDAVRRHPGADIVQPGVEVIDEQGQPCLPLADRVKSWLAPRGTETVLTGEELAASLLRGNWLYWPSLAFKRETIDRYRFREDLAVIQDLAVLMDIAFDGGSLLHVRRPAFRYRRHESSASQAALFDGTRFRDERRYYDEVRRRAAAEGWSKARRAASLRVMSRLHAVTELAHTVRAGNSAGAAESLRHVFY